MEDGFNVVGFNNPDGEILVCECVCVDELQFALSTPEVLKIMDAISLDPEKDVSRECSSKQRYLKWGCKLLGYPHTNQAKSDADDMSCNWRHPMFSQSQVDDFSRYVKVKMLLKHLKAKPNNISHQLGMIDTIHFNLLLLSFAGRNGMVWDGNMYTPLISHHPHQVAWSPTAFMAPTRPATTKKSYLSLWQPTVRRVRRLRRDCFKTGRCKLM